MSKNSKSLYIINQKIMLTDSFGDSNRRGHPFKHFHQNKTLSKLLLNYPDHLQGRQNMA